MPGTASRISQIAIAAVLIAAAANCFLKYIWWTACYSAWSGIPKMAEQWKAAGSHASFNGWSFIVLELASVGVLCTIMRPQPSGTSGFRRNALRVIFSCVVTLAGTALLALALSWLKQGIQY